MRGRFQSRGVAALLITSTAAALIGAPALAQKTGAATQNLPTPAAPPAPQASAPSDLRTIPPSAEETRPPDMIMDPPAAHRRPYVITNPSWAVRPMPEYPDTAMYAGVAAGRVTQRCVVMATGWLRDCEIIEETPPNMGFRESALAASAAARIAPRTVNGRAEAAIVQFTIRYVLPDEPLIPPVLPRR